MAGTEKIIKLKSIVASNADGISISLDEKFIFIADSYAGLRIYDISNKENP
jgi:hypothetical protein